MANQEKYLLKTSKLVIYQFIVTKGLMSTKTNYISDLNNLECSICNKNLEIKDLAGTKMKDLGSTFKFDDDEIILEIYKLAYVNNN